VIGRWLPAAALLAAASPLAPLAAQTIDTVVVDNHNIFDAGDNAVGFLARLADVLHVRTRAWVIRRTLLFDRGDRYDSARVLESERALRRLQVFRDVALDTTRVDGRFAVRVRTADGWSTKPEVGFSSSAGSVSWSAGLVESNLLGTANAVMGFYGRTPDRREATLVYQAPGFVLRRARLVAAYQSLSDGRLGWWSYGVPFYETSARASLQTYGEAGTQRVLRFRDGATADSVARRALRIGVSGGLALRATDRAFTRILVMAQLRRERFTPFGAAVPGDSQSAAVGLGFEAGSARYAVVESLDQYARREDVDISRRILLGVWVAPRAWGYAPGRSGLGPQFQLRLGVAWPAGFAWLRAGGDAVIGAAGLDSGRVEAGVTAMTQRFGRQTVVVHAEGGVASRVAPGTEFDLWLYENGPRAFAAHAFTGTRRYWLVAEDRVLLAEDFLGLVGVGIAPFAEWGGAWYGDERPRAGGDAGLALRLGATRSTRGEVTEIAVARRFGAGFTRGGWALTVRQAVDFR
jgi:hypothetical protein